MVKYVHIYTTGCAGNSALNKRNRYHSQHIDMSGHEVVTLLWIKGVQTDREVMRL
jgi:hypothetical protein